MRLDDRLKKLESKLPNDDKKINLIIIKLVGVGEVDEEIYFMKPSDNSEIYLRKTNETEEAFEKRAIEEYRLKINANSSRPLMFIAGCKEDMGVYNA